VYVETLGLVVTTVTIVIRIYKRKDENHDHHERRKDEICYGISKNFNVY